MNAVVPAPRQVRQSSVKLAWLGFIVEITLLTACAGKASAQVAAEATIQSDYIIRGISLSDHQPSATFVLTYDDPLGIYLGGSVAASWIDDGPRLLAVQGYAGYAYRLSPFLSADAGVIQTHYSEWSLFRDSIDYTEYYVGLSAPNVSAHVFVSPDYYDTGLATIYAQVEGRMDLTPKLSLNAHLGQLSYLEHPLQYQIPDRQDWRVTLSQQFGRSSGFVGVSGRITSGDSRDTTLTFGLSRSF